MPIIGLEPGVDHLGDVDVTVPEDQRTWRLLAAVARVALDANAEQLLLRHPLIIGPATLSFADYA